MNKRKFFFILLIVFYFIILKYMIGILFPFLLSLIFYFLIEPLIKSLYKKTHYSYSFIGFFILLIIFIIFVMALFLIIYALLKNKNLIYQVLIHIYNELIIDTFSFLSNKMDNVITFNKDFIINVLYSFSHFLINFISLSIKKIPLFFFSFFLFFLSLFFLALEYQEIKSIIRVILPMRFLNPITQLKAYLCNGILIYIRCECILFLITLSILFLGFKIIDIIPSFPLAFVVALLDAFPIIGLGIVLIPLIVLYIFKRLYLKAFYLLILYLFINGLRNIIEPYLLKKHFRIPSFIFFISMIIHYYCFGIMGIFLSPVHLQILFALLDLNKCK